MPLPTLSHWKPGERNTSRFPSESACRPRPEIMYDRISMPWCGCHGTVNPPSESVPWAPCDTVGPNSSHIKKGSASSSETGPGIDCCTTKLGSPVGVARFALRT